MPKELISPVIQSERLYASFDITTGRFSEKPFFAVVFLQSARGRMTAYEYDGSDKNRIRFAIENEESVWNPDGRYRFGILAIGI